MFIMVFEFLNFHLEQVQDTPELGLVLPFLFRQPLEHRAGEIPLSDPGGGLVELAGVMLLG